VGEVVVLSNNLKLTIELTLNPTTRARSLDRFLPSSGDEYVARETRDEGNIFAFSRVHPYEIEASAAFRKYYSSRGYALHPHRDRSPKQHRLEIQSNLELND
jgi:hypothetical protein